MKITWPTTVLMAVLSAFTLGLVWLLRPAPEPDSTDGLNTLLRGVLGHGQPVFVGVQRESSNTDCPAHGPNEPATSETAGH